MLWQLVVAFSGNRGDRVSHRLLLACRSRSRTAGSIVSQRIVVSVLTGLTGLCIVYSPIGGLYVCGSLSECGLCVSPPSSSSNRQQVAIFSH